jgi:DNA replication protein DnaC
MQQLEYISEGRSCNERESVCVRVSDKERERERERVRVRESERNKKASKEGRKKQRKITEAHALPIPSLCPLT